MKYFFLTVCLGFMLSQAQNKKELGQLSMENIPEIAPSIMETMTQYQNTRSAGFVDYTADGKSIIMSTRFGDVSQLHIINQPGGARKQLTFFKEPIANARVIPNEDKLELIFPKDAGGNEFAQLYHFNITTGKYEMITDGTKAQNSLPVWSNDGQKFIHTSTKRTGKDYDLYMGNVNDLKTTKLLLQVEGSWGNGDWSPKDDKILVSNYISANKSFYYILDLKTGQKEQINPAKEDIAYGSAIWAADGKGIFMVNDQGSEFSQLKYYDMATKKFTTITADIPWDVDNMTASQDRKNIAFTINDNGISKLFLMDATTKKYNEVKGLPIGIISGVSFNPKKLELGMSINTSQSPGDIYTYSVSDAALTKWTNSEVGGLNNSLFTIPTLIQYPTFDQVNGQARKIPAFYFKAKNANTKMPVVILIHGGPEGQFQPNFNSFVSFLNNEMNIAVIAPNVRGSSGYGKSYLKMDNGFSREESVKDIGALIDWIGTQPELDASRIAVYGGSYGGYMVLASMFHFNNKLKCGIDVVGISNFVTFLKNTEDYRKDLRRMEYGDERDPKMNAFQTKISPMNNVEKITKPLFIIQGKNDPRVPVTEAEQMKDKIQAQKGEAWYLLAKDEGHGFKKKSNIDFMQWSIVTFLQEKLVK
jgi:dipeptidyl aminopeptidase/acylaminoacyl peptidase